MYACLQHEIFSDNTLHTNPGAFLLVDSQEVCNLLSHGFQLQKYRFRKGIRYRKLLEAAERAFQWNTHHYQFLVSQQLDATDA